MLSVKDLQVYYGSIHAIKGVSFEVNEGEIVTLIGANGAGKTTTLHAICGLVKAKAGEITFCGQNLRTTDPHKIIRLGLAQVPEGRRIFARNSIARPNVIEFSRRSFFASGISSLSFIR